MRQFSMPRRCTLLSALLLATAPLGAQSAPPAAAGDSTARHTAPDSSTGDVAATATPAAAPSPLAGLKVSGYAEASYSAASHPQGGVIVGRLYDRNSNQFMLNAIKLAVDRPYATNRLDAGFHVDALVGQNASVLQSNGLTLGSQGDVTQLYATLNIPTANGNGVQVKLGKLVTLLGLEVIEDVLNPVWSEGNQFVYVENFTGTGLEVDYKFNPLLDAELRVYNGWDVVQDNNSSKSVMGRVGLTPDSLSSIGLVAYTGAEQPGNDRAKRYGLDLVASRRVGALALWLQGDWGREQANAALPDSTHAADWYALGMWASYDFTKRLGLALRADWLDDARGARTTAAFTLPPGGVRHELTSGTLTLNVRSWPNVLLRPELRLDHSNLAPFHGRSNQLSGAFSVAYVY